MLWVSAPELKGLHGYTLAAMLRHGFAQVRAIYLDGIATGNAAFEKQAPQSAGSDDSHLAICRLLQREAFVGESERGER